LERGTWPSVRAVFQALRGGGQGLVLAGGIHRNELIEVMNPFCEAGRKTKGQ